MPIIATPGSHNQVEFFTLRAVTQPISQARLAAFRNSPSRWLPSGSSASGLISSRTSNSMGSAFTGRVAVSVSNRGWGAPDIMR